MVPSNSSRVSVMPTDFITEPLPTQNNAHVFYLTGGGDRNEFLRNLNGVIVAANVHYDQPANKTIFDPSVGGVARETYEGSPVIEKGLVLIDKVAKVNGGGLLDLTQLKPADVETIETITKRPTNTSKIHYRFLHAETLIETAEYGAIKWSDIPVVDKIRCQVPDCIRTGSTSWNGVIRRDRGQLYLFDNGSRIKYSSRPLTVAGMFKSMDGVIRPNLVEPFAELIELVELFDMEAVCEKMGWIRTDNSPYPNQRAQQAACLSQLSVVSNLKYYEGECYFYTGSMWARLLPSELEYLLRQCAIKQGLAEINVIHHRFIKELCEQAFVEFKVGEFTKKSVLNLKNCSLDLANNKYTPFDPLDNLTHQLDFNYNAKALCPLWHKFLNRVMPDKDTQRTLQEVIGYLFTSGLKLEKIFFFMGSGANGKSVVFDVISAIAGRDNVSHYSLESLCDEQGYSRAEIENSFFNYGSDVSLKHVNRGVLKTMASGEPLGVRGIYQKPRLITNYAKLIFNVNTWPSSLVEHTDGFYRRIFLVPFSQTIPESEQDPDLYKKLLTEKAGILNWIIAGANSVMKNKALYVSKECNLFKDESMESTDNVACYLKDTGYRVDINSKVRLTILYNDYKQYCIVAGYKPTGRNKFAARLERLKIPKYKDRTCLIYFRLSVA